MENFYTKIRKLNAIGYTIEAQEEKEKLKQEWMKRYTQATDPQPHSNPQPRLSWTEAIANQLPHLSWRNESNSGNFSAQKDVGVHNPWTKQNYSMNSSFASNLAQQSSVIPPPPPPPPLSKKMKASTKSMIPLGVPYASLKKSEFPEKLVSLQAIVNGLSQSTKKDCDDATCYTETKQSDFYPSLSLNLSLNPTNKSDFNNHTINENISFLSKSEKRRAKKERRKARQVIELTEPIAPPSTGVIEIDIDDSTTQEEYRKVNNQYLPVGNTTFENSVKNISFGIGVPCPIHPINHLPSQFASSLTSNIQHLDMEISDDENDKDPQHKNLKTSGSIQASNHGSEDGKQKPILDTSSHSASISSICSSVKSQSNHPKSGDKRSFHPPRNTQKTIEKDESLHTKVTAAENRLQSSSFHKSETQLVTLPQELGCDQQQTDSSPPLASTEQPKVYLTQELAAKKIQLLKARARLLLAQKKQVEMMNSSDGQLQIGDCACPSVFQVPENLMVIDDGPQKHLRSRDATLSQNITAFSMPTLVINNIGSHGLSEFIHAPKRLKFMRSKTSNIEKDTISDIGNVNSGDDGDTEGSETAKSIELKLKIAKRRLELKLLEQSMKGSRIALNVNQKEIESTNTTSEWLHQLEKDTYRSDAVMETAEEYPQVAVPTAENLRSRQRELRTLIDVSKKNQIAISRRAVVDNLTAMVDKHRELLLEHGEKIKETSAELKDCINSLELEKSSIKTCECHIHELSSRKQILEKMVLDVTQKLIDSRRFKGEYECRKSS